MDNLRRAAFVSVGRACGFGGLAIFCFVAGMSFNPVLATRTGGILTLIMVLLLLFKHYRLRFQDHRKTELWLMLDRKQRPPEAFARRVACSALSDAYLWFARSTAAVSIVFFVAAIGLNVAGLNREIFFTTPMPHLSTPESGATAAPGVSATAGVSAKAGGDRPKGP